MCSCKLLWCQHCHLQAYSVMDFFAGRAALSKEVRQGGFRAAAVDKEYTRGMDINTPAGLATLV